MAKIRILDEEWSWKTTTLQQYLDEGNIPSHWKSLFEEEELREILKNISENISKDRIVFPPPNRVFRAFSIPMEKIKVVILGQDCYHDGNAVGICFSVPLGGKINPSLVNIYNELESEGYKPKRNGDLSPWVNQGCIMLNRALTVEKGNPESHLSYWYPFSERVLKYISENTCNVAWLLMGKHAASFKEYTESNGHKAFITSHPSPLSAYRKYQNYPAFIGSGIFKEINNFLGEKKIDW